jgi:hypothetical protein
VAEPADGRALDHGGIDFSPAPEAQTDWEARPVSEPQPAAEVASAASIAESVLMDHPEPKLAREPKIA